MKSIVGLILDVSSLLKASLRDNFAQLVAGNYVLYCPVPQCPPLQIRPSMPILALSALTGTMSWKQNKSDKRAIISA